MENVTKKNSETWIWWTIGGVVVIAILYGFYTFFSKPKSTVNEDYASTGKSMLFVKDEATAAVTSRLKAGGGLNS